MSRNALFTLFIIVALVVAIFVVVAQNNTATPEGTITIDTNQAGEQAAELAENTAEGFASLVDNFIARLNSVPQSDVVQVLMVLGGVILLVAGWRVYDWIIVIAGIFIGGTTAVAFVGDASTVMTIAAFLIGALIGAALGFFLYYLAVFFIGGYIGVIFTMILANALGIAPVSGWVFLIAVIIGGIVMLGLSFELLVVLASVVGAQLIVTALGLSPASFWLIGLTLLGIVFQIGLTRRSGFRVRRRPSRRLLFR